MADNRIEYRDGIPYFEGRSFVSFKEDKNRKSVFDNYYTALKYKYEMGYAAAEEYYQSLEILRDRYLTKGSDQWWKYSSEIVEFENEAAEEQARIAEEELELRGKTIDAIEKIEDEYYSRLDKKRSEYADGLKKDCDDLYSWRERHLSAGSGAIAVLDFTDFDDEIKRLEKYRALLNKFTSRVNPSEELLSEIYSMDLGSAIEFLTLADRKTDSQLSEYISNRQRYIDLCNDISKSQITELDENEVGGLAEKLEASLKRLGLNLPDGFDALFGRDGSDFVDGINALTEKINSSGSVKDALIGGFDISARTAELGTEAGNAFIDSVAEAVKSREGELQSLFSNVWRDASASAMAGGSTVSNTHNSFVIGTGKNTVREQIEQWRSEMELEKMRSN